MLKLVRFPMGLHVVGWLKLDVGRCLDYDQYHRYEPFTPINQSHKRLRS